jgi:ankyrin repeat protein
MRAVLRSLLVVVGAVWVAAISVATAAETRLLEAAEHGDRAAVLGLLAKGADPNAPGPDGTTAIMWAASNDDLELARALIKAGANVKLKNRSASALTEAAIVGSAPHRRLAEQARIWRQIRKRNRADGRRPAAVSTRPNGCWTGAASAPRRTGDRRP